MTELFPPPSVSSTRLQTQDGFEFLCALTSAEPTPERRERIANWNLFALDWSEVLRLAEYHGVLPLVARNLIELVRQRCRGLPPEVERSLRSAYEANLRRSLWFAAELARIMQHFKRRQLRALPYKGPVLAQSLYRDLGLRSFSDLDFLISPADFERAKQALAEIGYRPSAQVKPAIESPPPNACGCGLATSARLTAQPERTWSNCNGRCCRISMRSICAWKICWREPGRLSSAAARYLACLQKTRCWCCACTLPSIFGRG